MNKLDKKLIALGAKCEIARRRFFYYCNIKAPEFYKPDRKYLVDMCEVLQRFIEEDEHKVLIMDLPPRHGKSRTLQMLVEWLLGKDKRKKVMTGSYNETLSKTFAKSVRNSISELKGDMYKPVYSDIFPETRIKQGDGAVNLWSLEGGYNNYLATSPTGTATGFGCDVMIIDDLIKNAEEAYNETVKSKHWDWFTNTMLSRLEEGGKIVIVMTRWASDDLAGRALEHYGKENVLHINIPAVQEDGSMLCDEILSAESCNAKKKAMGFDIWSANYQQEPIDIKGRLYSSFKTYDGKLPKFKEVRNYTDTADTGDDYLCSINYGVTFENEAYVLDVLYTKAPMEQTEPETADMLYKGNVNIADIESNNGGRGFARSVERIMFEKYGSNHTSVRSFYQSKNKISRILSNATWVMNHVYFPSNWNERWPEYFSAMSRYQREGKNKHDDAPDATTGIAEKIGQGSIFSFD
ncbi:MAG: phage terminase large subunit [Phascolarctobacterium sp.]|nr:phage terminase large subunit [Phascolarctobacterium sp.]